jgi:hypothetical protein
MVKYLVGSVIVLCGKESARKSSYGVIVCDNSGKKGFVRSSKNGMGSSSSHNLRPKKEGLYEIVGGL